MAKLPLWIVALLLFFAVSSAYALYQNSHYSTPEMERAFACGFAYAKYKDHRTCPEFSGLKNVSDLNGQYGYIPP